MLKDITLLVVEDDQYAHKFFQNILKNKVKEYYEAQNGEEGLKIFKNKNPDIIITDINMPILHGIDMIKEIKKIDSEKNIVIISMHDSKSILLDAIELKIDYFIKKPIDIVALLEKLNKIAMDIKNRINLKKQQLIDYSNLHKLAHYDALTNIPNRHMFEIRLKEILSKAKRHENHFALFFIDLDNFKYINDTYGHFSGDEVLKHTAQKIKHIIREEDTVYRISGDEFCIILEYEKNNYILEYIAKKVQNIVHEPIVSNDKILQISCSIGICKYNKNIKTCKEMIELSDNAMYIAKKSGKNRYFIV